MNEPRTPIELLQDVHASYSALCDILPGAGEFAPFRTLLQSNNNTLSDLISFIESVSGPCSDMRESIQ